MSREKRSFSAVIRKMSSSGSPEQILRRKFEELNEAFLNLDAKAVLRITGEIEQFNDLSSIGRDGDIGFAVCWMYIRRNSFLQALGLAHSLTRVNVGSNKQIFLCNVITYFVSYYDFPLSAENNGEFTRKLNDEIAKCYAKMSEPERIKARSFFESIKEERFEIFFRSFAERPNKAIMDFLVADRSYASEVKKDTRYKLLIDWLNIAENFAITKIPVGMYREVVINNICLTRAEVNLELKNISLVQSDLKIVFEKGKDEQNQHAIRLMQKNNMLDLIEFSPPPSLRNSKL